jgi:hypothetical protein
MLTVIALLAGTQPAFAMNWEGHDDWMAEFPPVQEFIDSAPEAKPPSPRDCPIGPVARADNPYEQIPLRGCPAPHPENCPEASGPPEGQHAAQHVIG